MFFCMFFFFFKQKTAYEMRISDWSSDVCSSDLSDAAHGCRDVSRSGGGMKTMNDTLGILVMNNQLKKRFLAATIATVGVMPVLAYAQTHAGHAGHTAAPPATSSPATASGRSEEHTSELQSLMRISYAVLSL